MKLNVMCIKFYQKVFKKLKFWTLGFFSF